MNIFEVFRQRFSSPPFLPTPPLPPPPPPPRFCFFFQSITGLTDQTLLRFPVRLVVGEDVCLSGATGGAPSPAPSEESSIVVFLFLFFWMGGVRWGGVGEVFVLFFFPRSDGQPAVEVTMVVQ